MAELIMTEEGSTPSIPATSKWKLYFKSGGLYAIEDTGTEIGPIKDKTYFDTLYTALNGWISGTGTWSYSSADSPTFVISINADVTGLIGVGDRIKLTQTTVKYFIVTAVGSFSGGATLVTVYGGTDYTLANAAVTSPYYSNVKAPFGFPLDPAKWTIDIISDTSNASQASPTTSTWYNVGSLNGAIHIGTWRIVYELAIEATASPGAATTIGIKSTISTANNSESDATMSTFNTASVPAMSGAIARYTVHRERFLTLASKTTYYLNALTGASGITTIAIRGDLITTSVKAVCAYL